MRGEASGNARNIVSSLVKRNPSRSFGTYTCNVRDASESSASGSCMKALSHPILDIHGRISVLSCCSAIPTRSAQLHPVWSIPGPPLRLIPACCTLPHAVRSALAILPLPPRCPTTPLLTLQCTLRGCCSLKVMRGGGIAVHSGESTLSRRESVGSSIDVRSWYFKMKRFQRIISTKGTSFSCLQHNNQGLNRRTSANPSQEPRLVASFL